MGWKDKLFGGRASADDRELGLGVWRRAHDRFTRAVDRFYLVVAGIDDDVARAGASAKARGGAEKAAGADGRSPRRPEGVAGPDGTTRDDAATPAPDDPREVLASLTHTLNGLADDVRGLCRSAQHLVPSDRLTVPAGPGGSLPELHRELSRAATLVAQAAEAATMTRVALRLNDDQAASRARAAVRAVTLAADHVTTAAGFLPAEPAA